MTPKDRMSSGVSSMRFKSYTFPVFFFAQNPTLSEVPCNPIRITLPHSLKKRRKWCRQNALILVNNLYVLPIDLAQEICYNNHGGMRLVLVSERKERKDVSERT